MATRNTRSSSRTTQPLAFRRRPSLPTAEEMKRRLSHIGLTEDNIKAHLLEKGFSNEEKRKGRAYMAYRIKKVFGKNCRPSIGLVKLVSLYACMRDVPGFNFALMAPAFNVEGKEAVTEFARWCNHFVEVMKVDDLIPDDVQKTNDDATMADNLANPCDSLEEVWEVLERHTRQIGLIRNEIREIRSTLIRALEAPIAIPTTAVVQTDPQVEEPLFVGRRIDVEAPDLESENRPLETQTPPKPDREYLVEKLPPLSNYTLETLMHEWLVEFEVVGMQEKLPMRKLELLRSEACPNELPWRHPKLRNAVFKRKTICEHVQRIAESKHGGQEPQQIRSAIEDVRSVACEKLGSRWTLRGLYNDIKGYKDKKSAK